MAPSPLPSSPPPPGDAAVCGPQRRGSGGCCGSTCCRIAGGEEGEDGACDKHTPLQPPCEFSPLAANRLPHTAASMKSIIPLTANKIMNDLVGCPLEVVPRGPGDADAPAIKPEWGTTSGVLPLPIGPCYLSLLAMPPKPVDLHVSISALINRSVGPLS
jgi:hypothetical protein